MSDSNAAPSSETSETPSLVNQSQTTETPTQTTDTETKTEAKPETEAKAETAEFVPIAADALTIPDGMQVDDALRDEFLGLLNNREMTPVEQANALLALQGKALGLASEANSTAWSDMNTTWQTEVRNDPDIGGAKLEPALGRIAQLTKEFGSEELNAVFDLTGAGNNIHVIKFLDKIASAMTEGGHVLGNPQTSNTQSLADKLYGNKG